MSKCKKPFGCRCAEDVAHHILKGRAGAWRQEGPPRRCPAQGIDAVGVARASSSGVARPFGVDRPLGVFRPGGAHPPWLLVRSLGRGLTLQNQYFKTVHQFNIGRLFGFIWRTFGNMLMKR